MTNLFTNYAIIKSVMKEARRSKPSTEKVAIKIQKEIDYAAEHGRGDVIVYTGDFHLTVKDREIITQELQKAGYRHRWRKCNSEDELIHVWWWDEADAKRIREYLIRDFKVKFQKSLTPKCENSEVVYICCGYHRKWWTF